MVFMTLLVGVLVLGVWYLTTWRRDLSKYAPGPTPWPFIGNIIELGKHSKIFYALEHFKKKYGDIYTIYLGSRPTIVITSMELVREAFLQKQNEFAGRQIDFTTLLFSKGKDIVGGDFGPIWKQQRKIAHSAIRKFASGDILARLIENSSEKVFTTFDEYAESGKPLEPERLLGQQIYNIVTTMIMGKMFDLKDPVLVEFIEGMRTFQEKVSDVQVVDMFPILQYFLRKRINVLVSQFKSWHKYVEEVYEEHVQNYDENHITDLVYHVIHSAKELERKEGKEAMAGLTIDHYKMIILDLFVAGNETSRASLLWCVLYMAAFPEKQKKMQEELDEVVGSGPITIEHHKRLPYCEAFLHEVLRIRPLAPVAVPHKTMCDTTLGGYKIPAGMQVIASIWSIHMCEKEWGDPEAFRPERFLDEEGKMLPRSYSWLPFSTGRRVCVGEALAKAEIHLSLAHYVRRYSFRAPDGILIDASIRLGDQGMFPNKYEIIVSKRK